MGIFNSASVFTTYHTKLEFRDKVMGGVPREAKAIEGWLRAKAGIEDVVEIQERMRATLIEMGVENVGPDTSYEDIVKASEALASKSGVGFKRDDNGLYIEGRQVKAMLKECTNILFAGQRWLATKKGPKAVAAERIFSWQDKLYLGVQEPSGVELLIGHITGPQGPRSTLTYHEYVERAVIEFDLLVAQDALKQEQWEMLWVQAQENGLGAVRSQGFGRFDIWEFSKVETPQNRIADRVPAAVLAQMKESAVV